MKILIFVLLALSTFGETPAARPKLYQLSDWTNMTCRFKGRFQDREYCHSPVIDRIVADGKPAIPVLISQITDSCWIAEPVYDFWPRVRAGELAHFILSDLFVDDTWKNHTIPNLFPERHCSPGTPGWDCWGEFRKGHSLADIQARWMKFWVANQASLYWDAKARCFRLADAKQAK